MGLLIGAIATGCFVVLRPFLSALSWAAVLVMATWPAADWLHRRARLPKPAVATAMVAITTLLLVVPLAAAAPGGAADIRSARLALEAWLADVPPAPPWLEGLPLAGPALAGVWNQSVGDLSGLGTMVKPYVGVAVEQGLSLLLGVAGGFAQLGLALFASFFFWLQGEALAAALRRIVQRVAGPYAADLIAATEATVRGTVYGVVGTAILQGFLTAFGLELAGVPRPVLLGTVAAFLAVLPIGAPLVWIPGGLWLLANGHTGHGVFLLIYGAVAVSGTDHIVRPYFIARGTKLPFLLTVLGVLGGVLAFGVLGIVLGPVLLGVGFTLTATFLRAEHAIS